MNRRTIIVLPILPFWAFIGIFGLVLAATIEIGLLGLVLGLIELLLVRNGLPPANHPLRFHGPTAALALALAFIADYQQHVPRYAGRPGLTILGVVLAILVWSAIDAYALPR